MITHGSLFTGIGGFDKGFEKAEIKTIWQVEIDKDCRKVLDARWPDVPKYDDVRNVKELPHVNILSFGSPCQDISTAGKRKGLAGERSGLFFEATRIIQQVKPDIAVWENVAGTFSSSAGRDFASVIVALANSGALDIGWRVLDSQWFGVAQKRRRIFVVADFTGRRAEKILALSESLSGHPKPFRETRQDIMDAVTAGIDAAVERDIKTVSFRKSRRAQSVVDYETWAVDDVSNTLNTFDLGDVRTTQIIAFNTHNKTTLSGTQTLFGVRRLTPVECERLMGHEDDFTNVDNMSDNKRYKMLGNGVVVPVAAWIAENIRKAFQI